jgi:hypothetical protein
MMEQSVPQIHPAGRQVVKEMVVIFSKLSSSRTTENT